jgi:hypothetical protein
MDSSQNTCGWWRLYNGTGPTATGHADKRRASSGTISDAKSRELVSRPRNLERPRNCVECTIWTGESDGATARNAVPEQGDLSGEAMAERSTAAKVERRATAASDFERWGYTATAAAGDSSWKLWLGARRARATARHTGDVSSPDGTSLWARTGEQTTQTADTLGECAVNAPGAGDADYRTNTTDTVGGSTTKDTMD